MPLNLTALRAFHTVATSGSFTAAAQQLRVTQPTLSAQVKALEDEHGVRLFERQPRGVAPTEPGAALLAVTHQLFELVDEAEQTLSASRELKRGQLRVGADAPARVMEALATFRRRHPAVELAVSLGNSGQLLTAVRERRVDLAVLANVGPDPRLHIQPLQRDALVLVAARQHRWARRAAVAIEELTDQPLVVREQGSTTRAIFERTLARHKIVTGPLLEIGSREGVREAAAAGLGIGVVFDSEFGNDDRLVKLALSNAEMHGTEYAICLKKHRRRAAVEVFLGLLGDGGTPNS